MSEIISGTRELMRERKEAFDSQKNSLVELSKKWKTVLSKFNTNFIADDEKVLNFCLFLEKLENDFEVGDLAKIVNSYRETHELKTWV